MGCGVWIVSSKSITISFLHSEDISCFCCAGDVSESIHMVPLLARHLIDRAYLEMGVFESWHDWESDKDIEEIFRGNIDMSNKIYGKSKMTWDILLVKVWVGICVVLPFKFPIFLFYKVPLHIICIYQFDLNHLVQFSFWIWSCYGPCSVRM